jgi:NAD(P)-dependent dehydrogenase (short-subunit alcohol dehydrogenase family)
MNRLRGKVAIVVGSATGMGAAGATLMAQEGAKVVLADINIDGAEAGAAEIRRAGGEATAFEVDISNELAVKAMVEFTVKQYGRVDVLHNNAANFSPDVIGPDTATDILHLDLAIFDRTIAVNLRGFILTTKYAVPEMVKRGGGSIINTSSGTSLKPQLSQHAYSISKSGVNMLTLAVATAYGKQGIRCNAVLPGLVLTGPMTHELVDRVVRHNLTPYAGLPQDLANVFVFLASDESRYITGQLIQVDGGVFAHTPTYADTTAAPAHAEDGRPN